MHRDIPVDNVSPDCGSSLMGRSRIEDWIEQWSAQADLAIHGSWPYLFIGQYRASGDTGCIRATHRFAGTFHASVFSVAAPSGITFFLGSSLSQGGKLDQKHPEPRQWD